METRPEAAVSERVLTQYGAAQQRGAPGTRTRSLPAFPKRAGRRGGVIAGRWPRPQWKTLADSHTPAPRPGERYEAA